MKKKALLTICALLVCGVVGTSAFAAAVQIVSKKGEHTIVVGEPIELSLIITSEESTVYPNQPIALAIAPQLNGQTGYGLYIVDLKGTSTEVDGYNDDVWQFSPTETGDYYGKDIYSVSPIVDKETIASEEVVTVYVKLNTDDKAYYNTNLTIVFQLLNQA